MTITAPDKPGRYALKFDLVSEGIDSFRGVRVADDDENAGGDLRRSPRSDAGISNGMSMRRIRQSRARI